MYNYLNKIINRTQVIKYRVLSIKNQDSRNRMKESRMIDFASKCLNKRPIGVNRQL